MQTLILASQRKRLLANGQRNAAGGDTVDFQPVVKLFCPWGSGTWLLSELDPDNPDIAFGLCDPGLGSPELGSVSLSEIRAVRGPFGLYIERDIHFTANKTLGQYAEVARNHGRIQA